MSKKTELVIEHTDVAQFLDLAPTKVGGIELFCRALAVALRRRGLSITFIFSTQPSELVKSLLEGPNVQIIDLGEQRAFSLNSAREIFRLLRQLRPTTVMYSLGGILRPLPWICKLAGVESVIYNDHASREPSCSATNALKLLAARAITKPVDGVIAVSEFVAECNRTERMHRAPVHVIPNAVDLSRRRGALPRQQFLAQHGIPQDRLIVSQLSSLIQEKGIDTFLRAAEIVLRNRKDVHFVIGGEGPSRSEFEDLAVSLRISNNVSFIGTLDDPLASGLYPASDVSCLASRWFEAWGLVLIEAMSFGVPVVATRIGGIPEFICDGVEGFLREGKPEAFADAITTLLEDPALRRKMGAAGRERVEREFDVTKMAERYVSFLVHEPAPEKKSAADA